MFVPIYNIKIKTMTKFCLKYVPNFEKVFVCVYVCVTLPQNKITKIKYIEILTLVIYRQGECG